MKFEGFWCNDWRNFRLCKAPNFQSVFLHPWPRWCISPISLVSSLLITPLHFKGLAVSTQLQKTEWIFSSFSMNSNGHFEKKMSVLRRPSHPKIRIKIVESFPILKNWYMLQKTKGFAMPSTLTWCLTKQPASSGRFKYPIPNSWASLVQMVPSSAASGLGGVQVVARRASHAGIVLAAWGHQPKHLCQKSTSQSVARKCTLAL